MEIVKHYHLMGQGYKKDALIILEDEKYLVKKAIKRPFAPKKDMEAQLFWMPCT